MGRLKGSKNKPKESPKTGLYSGFFIMESGLRMPFHIGEDEADERIGEMFECCEFNFADDETIMVDEGILIRAKKVIGFIIDYDDNSGV